jgi:hypothetical protein
VPQDRPPLSIVVATRAGRAGVAACLASFADDARRLGAEIIVGDGSDASDGSSSAANTTTNDGVTWIRRPGASVFALYGIGIAHATGSIIAVTEDHCFPAPGWCDAIIAAHARHPEALAIGGVIENAATESAIDWAAFLRTHATHLAPLDRVSLDKSNIAFKRDGVRHLPTHAGQGVMLLHHLLELQREPDRVAADPALVVHHYQHASRTDASVLHFHDGRAITGLRRSRMRRGDWIRLGVIGVLPYVRSARVIRAVARKGRLAPEVVRALPLMLWLQWCFTAGELTGYIGGAGDSAKQLH